MVRWHKKMHMYTILAEKCPVNEATACHGSGADDCLNLSDGPVLEGNKITRSDRVYWKLCNRFRGSCQQGCHQGREKARSHEVRVEVCMSDVHMRVKGRGTNVSEVRRKVKPNSEDSNSEGENGRGRGKTTGGK